jgi:hypothetical protein
MSYCLVTGITGSNPAQGMNVCLCVSVLCCPVQVEAFAMGRSLIQRSPTVCVNNKIKKPQKKRQRPDLGCSATGWMKWNNSQTPFVHEYLSEICP